jgi:hypothetical protein
MRYLSLFALAVVLNSCVTIIPNTTECSVAGVLAAGMDCAETLSSMTYELNLDQTIDFLSPQLARECVPIPGTTICTNLDPAPDRPSVRLPARAGAVGRSAEDAEKIKTALDQACRRLGRQCSHEMRQAITNI